MKDTSTSTSTSTSMSNSGVSSVKAFTLVELLVAIAVAAALLGLYVTNLSSSRNSTREGIRATMQQQLNNTYSQWIQLGGTHSGEIATATLPQKDNWLIQRSWPYAGQFDIDYQIVSANPVSDDRVQVTVQFDLNNSDRTCDLGFSSNGSDYTITGVSSNTPATYLITGYAYKSAPFEIRLKFYDNQYRNSHKTYDVSSLFAPLEPSNNLTEEMWKALAATDPNVPYSSDLPDAIVKDSSGPVNSSSIRIKQYFDGDSYVSNGNESISYKGHDITFTPTGTNSGYWTVLRSE